MFLFFQYFYSILQSFVVDVEPIPPVYVKCMMKYEKRKYVTHTLCKHPGYVVYNAPSSLYCRIYDGIFTIYSTHYCEDALGTSPKKRYAIIMCFLFFFLYMVVIIQHNMSIIVTPNVPKD